MKKKKKLLQYCLLENEQVGEYSFTKQGKKNKTTRKWVTLISASQEGGIREHHHRTDVFIIGHLGGHYYFRIFSLFPWEPAGKFYVFEMKLKGENMVNISQWLSLLRVQFWCYNYGIYMFLCCIWLNQLQYHYILKFQHRHPHWNYVLNIKLWRDNRQVEGQLSLLKRSM